MVTSVQERVDATVLKPLSFIHESARGASVVFDWRVTDEGGINAALLTHHELLSWVKNAWVTFSSVGHGDVQHKNSVHFKKS